MCKPSASIFVNFVVSPPPIEAQQVCTNVQAKCECFCSVLCMECGRCKRRVVKETCHASTGDLLYVKETYYKKNGDAGNRVVKGSLVVRVVDRMHSAPVCGR